MTGELLADFLNRCPLALSLDDRVEVYVGLVVAPLAYEDDPGLNLGAHFFPLSCGPLPHPKPRPPVAGVSNPFAPQTQNLL